MLYVGGDVYSSFAGGCRILARVAVPLDGGADKHPRCEGKRGGCCCDVEGLRCCVQTH